MRKKSNRTSRGLFALLAVLPLVVLVLGTLYMLGMNHLEGSPRTFLQGLQWASETMTNTGYGADNHWSHPVMALFVIVTPFIGQLLVFLIFPVLVLPYFEEKFEVRLPQVLPPMDGKVLFYRFGPAIESLLVEFDGDVAPNELRNISGVLAVNSQGTRTWALAFDPANDIRPAVFEFAVKKGVKVLTMQKAERGLEEVFKELTKGVDPR